MKTLSTEKKSQLTADIGDSSTEYSDNTENLPLLCHKLIQLPGWPAYLGLSLQTENVSSPHYFSSSRNSNEVKKTIYLYQQGENYHYYHQKNGTFDYVYPITPDGNCFYHAILTALTPDEKNKFLCACKTGITNNTDEVQIIRNALANYILRNQDEITPYLSGITINELVSDVAQSGNWNGQHGDIVPYLITRLPGYPETRSLFIYRRGSTVPLTTISPPDQPLHPQNGISLLLEQNHYEVILNPTNNYERKLIKLLPNATLLHSKKMSIQQSYMPLITKNEQNY